MVDFNKLIGLISGSGVGAGLAGGVAGGALVSALTTKSGRKAAKSVAQIGGLAAVGALAWNAYKKYQGDKPVEVQQHEMGEQQAHTPTEWQQLSRREFDALAGTKSASEGLLVLRSMIAAAMADGRLSPQEQALIFERLDKLGLTSEERDTLFDELRNPLSCQVLVAQVSDPVLAIEVYTAAVMILESGCTVSGNYLGQLAAGLKLPEPLVLSIHRNMAVPQLADAS
ncbi:MAG: tellurite resistance TerB family protein [Gammaproteobacteria bacterium]|jgi:uncharacterized membrane protein YebE (DUF533 family)|nr:tellurite resistance TerB family protein [Gammaproteobacteria bacterium]